MCVAVRWCRPLSLQVCRIVFEEPTQPCGPDLAIKEGVKEMLHVESHYQLFIWDSRCELITFSCARMVCEESDVLIGCVCDTLRVRTRVQRETTLFRDFLSHALHILKSNAALYTHTHALQQQLSAFFFQLIFSVHPKTDFRSVFIVFTALNMDKSESNSLPSSLMPPFSIINWSKFIFVT